MILSIDIGGTNLRAICDEFSVSISSRDIGLYSFIAQRIKKHPNITKVAISYAGQVDSGVIYSSPNISIDECNIASRIFEEFDVELVIDNDLNCALLAESEHFKSKNIAVIYIGTGLGASVMSRGEIVRGVNNSAFELGHIPFIKYSDIRCGCGRDNCLELSSSGSGLIKQLKNNNINLYNIKSEYQDIYKNFIDGVLYAAGVIVTLANPEILVLGGGVIDKNSDIVSIVRDNIEHYALLANLKNLQIVQSELKNGSLEGAKLLFNK